MSAPTPSGSADVCTPITTSTPPSWSESSGSCWLFVAHESEIPEPGDYVTRVLGVDPVIVVRDERARSRCCTTRAGTAA